MVGTEINVNTVAALIADNLHISTRHLLANLNISQMAIVWIVRELDMCRISSTWVLYCLTMEQMRKQIEVCEEWLRMMNSEGDLMTMIVTGNEMIWWRWLCQGMKPNYAISNPLLKQESNSWKLPGQAWKTKVRHQRSSIIVILMAFFDSKGMLYQNFAAPNSTVNSAMYHGVLRNLWYISNKDDPISVTSGYCITITWGRMYPPSPLNFWNRNSWSSSPTHWP